MAFILPPHETKQSTPETSYRLPLMRDDGLQAINFVDTLVDTEIKQFIYFLIGAGINYPKIAKATKEKGYWFPENQ